MHRRLVVLGLLIVLTLAVAGLFAFGLSRDPRIIPSPLVMKPAPAFTLPLFAGGALNTESLRGKVLIVNFWASWCYPACYEEAPRLQRVWERFRARGVVVIGVNIQDQEMAARRFIDRFGQTFPNGMDPTGRISIDYGIFGVPETFVIDQNGVIVDKFIGAVPEEWMVNHILRLLRREPPVP